MQHYNDKQRKEQLSALLDNDMKREELTPFMDDLKRDPLTDGDTLQRYQLIGKTLRGELDAAAFMDVSAAVQRAINLEAEPVTNVRQLRPRWVASAQKMMRPAAGLAIAASVAMVTVVSVRMLDLKGAEPLYVATPHGQISQDKRALTPLNLTPAPVVPVNAQLAQQVQVVASTRTNILPPAAEQTAPQLNDYLLRHSGVAGQAGMQGVMPYARVVSFEREGVR